MTSSVVRENSGLLPECLFVFTLASCVARDTGDARARRMCACGKSVVPRLCYRMARLLVVRCLINC